MDFYRRVVSRPALRDRRGGGAADRPADAHAGHPPHAPSARPAALDPGAARPARALLRRASTRPPASAKALPFEMQLLRLEFEPWRPVDILSLGKLLAFGLSTNWERELLRADMVRALGPELAAQARPGLPGRQPGRHPGSLVGRRPGAGRADRRGARARSGWPPRRAAPTTGRSAARAQRDRLAADRRRPAPAAEHAGHLVPGRPHAAAIASSAAPRCPGMPGVYMGQNNDVCWTFTNVMADVQDLFVERIEGDALPVRGRVAAARGRRARRSSSRGATAPERLDVRDTHHGPIVNEALGADDAEPLALRWLTLDEPTAFTGRCSSCTRSAPVPSWSRLLAGYTLAPPRTWSGPTATARSATS